MTSVACLSDTFCIAAGGGANQADLTGTDGAGLTESWDGTAWSDPSTAFPAPDQPSGPWPVLPVITCTEGPFCVVVEAGGAVTNGDGTDWIAPVALPPAPSVAPNPSDPGPGHPGAREISVACPSARFCAIVDNTGSIWTWSDGTWLPTRSFTAPGPGGIGDPVSLYAPGRVGLACPTPSACTAVIGSTALDWNGSAWSEEPVAWGPQPGPTSAAVACPTPSLCAIVTGSAVSVRVGTAAWSPPTSIDPGGVLDSISCPTATFCMAADTAGAVVSWDGSTWSAPATVLPAATEYPGIGTTVSCTSDQFCMVVNGDGDYATFTGPPTQPAAGP